MSVDHSSGVEAPKVDPVFLRVRAGMTVIVEDGSDWRMADVIWLMAVPGTRAHPVRSDVDWLHQLGQRRW